MGVLDHIIKIEMLDTTTVNGNFNSEMVAIDGAEGGFAITVTLSNGNGSVNMDFSLEVSTNGVSFAEIADSIQTFVDDDGSIVFDVLDTNTVFVRLKVAHTGGSIDASAQLTAQRRH